MKQFLIIIIIVFGIKNISNGQGSVEGIMNFSYGIDQPFGDMADRFGYNFSPGLDLEFIHNKKYFYGIHGQYMIGSRVKEDVVAPLRHETGLFITQLMDLTRVTLKERAYLVGIHGGAFYNISKKEYQHGPRVRLGVNMLTHYIIFNDETASIYQLRGNYASGYDRLTRGFGLEQFLGYQFIPKSGRSSLFCGFNVVEAKTKSLRPIDFDTGEYGGNERWDILVGFRGGFTFQLFEIGNKEAIYYY